ncbi:hypothetical protein KCH_10300 [Kitasatospora cheerisanensis KCTC 2395]|uniref:Uncharacterized protein n=1 Tax=Kitasatospora cheerisanensis KCTC 2395 TaxID=1348663 RepID=A0A066Z4R4_9ACTN|nr:hypothetical protein KCH_10300 [Kitasatospora cheerisanensis KCTC 2395]
MECVVIGHQHYGPRTRTVAGDLPGYVDASVVSDDPGSSREDWPAVGQRLDCVVLGQTRDGRLRLSARPRDIELIRSVAEVRTALTGWRALAEAGDEAAGVREFLRTPEALPTLRWALRHPAGSEDRVRAEAMVERMPEGMRQALHRYLPGRGGRTDGDLSGQETEERFAGFVQRPPEEHGAVGTVPGP